MAVLQAEGIYWVWSGLRKLWLLFLTAYLIMTAYFNKQLWNNGLSAEAC